MAAIDDLDDRFRPLRVWRVLRGTGLRVGGCSTTSSAPSSTTAPPGPGLRRAAGQARHRTRRPPRRDNLITLLTAAGLLDSHGDPMTITPHQLRHTWATSLANAGTSPQALPRPGTPRRRAPIQKPSRSSTESVRRHGPGSRENAIGRYVRAPAIDRQAGTSEVSRSRDHVEGGRRYDVTRQPWQCGT